jgi:ATP-dependent RNA helicase RhlE
VHRIGRTARAGASGVAISFCDAAQQGTLRAIERMTGISLHTAGGSAPIVQTQRTPAPAESQPSRRRRRKRPMARTRLAA